ncbi:MAG: hypothetical protein IKR17_03675 [Bacteroidales bacterium]|nr:hypothetical protein [Bacteroidales bacterium]
MEYSISKKNIKYSKDIREFAARLHRIKPMGEEEKLKWRELKQAVDKIVEVSIDDKRLCFGSLISRLMPNELEMIKELITKHSK